MEQRNSYIASIKSKIEKLENIITHLRNRINLQREIVDKDYDNESLSDAKREENAEKSNEVIRKWNNVSNSASRLLCYCITNMLLCF